MHLNEPLIIMLKRHEGFRAKPYKDTVGVLTIGYGHNLDEPLSKEAADALLRTDIRRAIRDLIVIFPDLYEFGERRANALIDMMFNLGKTRFLGFEQMIAAIKDKDWQLAADEAKDSDWFVQVKSRGEEIVSMLKEV